MVDAIELKRLETEAAIREVYDLRVFVVGGGFQYVKMFFDAGFRGARNVEEADIVCFTGGEDVDPSLYGERAINGTNYHRPRDDFESRIYGECLGLKKAMIGICRGSQFLTVMNGGKLWQDVNNHATGATHPVTDCRTGEVREGMTSTHHQMMIPGPGAQILALAALATRKTGEKTNMERSKPDFDDVEVVWYADTLSLCFQPHPEFSHGACRDYFLELVDDFIIPAC